MTLTITGAAYANGNSSAVVIETVERGAVAISEQDRPELWALFLLWQKAGGTPEMFALPPPVKHTPPSVEAKLQMFLRRNPDVLAHLQAKVILRTDLRA